MKIIKKNWFWATLFLFIFLLTQDYLFIHWPKRISLGGFPLWLLWFMGVHVLFMAVFYWFMKKFWKE